MATTEHITQVIAALDQPIISQAVVGIDGYIDQIVQVVKSKSVHTQSYIETIDAFATRVAKVSGKSGQFEIATKTVKLGGNAPIMANTLTSLGFQTTCIGTLGMPEIHPVFKSMEARLISVGAPAQTQALEFSDGKLILSELSTFAHMNWAAIEQTLGKDSLIEVVRNHDLIAMVGICNLPHGEDILRGFSSFIQQYQQSPKRFFIDLADPSRKSESELSAMLHQIGALRQSGEVILGLNENEALQIDAFYHKENSPQLPLVQRAIRIYHHLNIDELLIHPVDRSIIVNKNGCTEARGHVVQNPKILTGAGDNLNAGYCMGKQLNLSPNECLVLGMASAGAYITLGYSPGKEELRTYLTQWAATLQEN